MRCKLGFKRGELVTVVLEKYPDGGEDYFIEEPQDFKKQVEEWLNANVQT